MSHSPGACRFPDGQIFHLEYNGTSDVMLPALMANAHEVWVHWRHGEDIEGCVPCPHIGGWARAIACKHSPERVEIATEYGNGFWWVGAGCLICRVLTSGTISDPESEHDGYPEWYPHPKPDV